MFFIYFKFSKTLKSKSKVSILTYLATHRLVVKFAKFAKKYEYMYMYLFWAFNVVHIVKTQLFSISVDNCRDRNGFLLCLCFQKCVLCMNGC